MECDMCGKSFTRRDNLKRHQRSAKACQAKQSKLAPEADRLLATIRCGACDINVGSRCYSAHLKSNLHKRNSFVVIDDGVEKMAGAFGDKIVSYRITDPDKFRDINDFAIRIREKILNLITSSVDLHDSIKLNMECFGLYYLSNPENVEIKSFNTKNQIITKGSDLYQIYQLFIEEMSSKMGEFQDRDSGWALLELLAMEVNIHKFNPMRASSYVELPSSVKAKHAVINVQNMDDSCFAWAITSAMCQPNGPSNRTSSYPHFSNIGVDFTNLEFPVKLREIPKFEQRNDISINVYGINSFFDGRIMIDEIITLYICNRKRNTHINLLIVSDDKGNNHYCWVKNLSRLVSSQASRGGHEKYICDGCLVYFQTESALDRHQSEDCGKVRIILPSTESRINKYGQMVKSNVVQFLNLDKQLKVPFVVYADFEALLKPINRDKKFRDEGSYTVKCFEHEPYSFAYYIKCSYDDTLSKFELYRGSNAAEIFMNTLEVDIKNIYRNQLSDVKPMIPLSKYDELMHQRNNVCHICEKPFVTSSSKVYDHDHLTGKYRGPAHSTCNIHYQIPKFIPVIFHNLSNYDCHMFIKSIALNDEDVDVIAQNKEKYISFSKKIHVGETVDVKGRSRKVHIKIRFIDSFRFMACKLETLGSFLTDDQCVEIKRKFTEPDKFKLIRQKGVFPYSFVDSFEKLKLRSLPSREHFYNLLVDEHISDEDYARALTVWNEFNCETLGEYSDVYLTADVLLLTDVFENFRNISLEYYKLDPGHYFTAPGYGWDALLRMTGIELELLTDVDMLHFFKNGIRGGLSMCTKRAAIANNQFMSDYDSTKPSSYIIYLDATNLYGHAMRRKLPVGGFRWLTTGEIEHFDVCDVSENSEVGYLLEVDLEYPLELHDHHNDFPFCPENTAAPGSGISKLMVNLYNKSKYIIHYENLKQCLQHGLKLKQIHRVLKFKQLDWMKPYIDFNSLKRENATNEFEKNQYKAMNNIVFGKTMENVENRVDIKLLTHWEHKHRSPGIEAFVARPNFKSAKIFCDHLVAVEMGHVEVCYNKPLYVGFTILELAKTVMYDFFYNFVKRKYGCNSSLLYTDTDSLVLEIATANVYDDIKEHMRWFDTSNYPVNNMHKIPRTSQILGNMKDEFPNNIIRSFYGTGAKAYCINLQNDVCVKKAKGVKKSVIKNNLSCSDYKRIVDCGGNIFKQMYVFRSDYHTMYTELKNKVALSHKDDKRYVLQDGYKTLAWGHKAIPNLTEDVDLDNLLTILNENIPD